MPKTTFGPKPFMYPAPVLIVGAIVDGKPNFTTIAWGGVACSDPPMVSIALRAERYIHDGVIESQTFSVNVPPKGLIIETDFCGTTTGRKINKAEACGLDIFYGKLESAPMIEQCAVNLECEVVHTLKLGAHTLFVGKVVETFVENKYITEGKADIAKIQPMIYATGTNAYFALGDFMAGVSGPAKDLRKKFQIGRE